MKTVHSVEEFRHLYYPDADPALDYLDGGVPEPGDEEEDQSSPSAVEPLERLHGAHLLHRASEKAATGNRPEL